MLYCSYLEPQLNHLQGFALLLVNRPRGIPGTRGRLFICPGGAFAAAEKPQRRPQGKARAGTRAPCKKRAGAGAPRRKKNAPSGRGRPARGSRTPAQNRFGGSLSGCRCARRAEFAQPGTAANDQDGGGGSTPPGQPPFRGGYPPRSGRTTKAAPHGGNLPQRARGAAGAAGGQSPPKRPTLPRKNPPKVFGRN